MLMTDPTNHHHRLPQEQVPRPMGPLGLSSRHLGDHCWKLKE